MRRITYEQMAAHCPTAADEYAAPTNSIPKVAFSQTPRAEWAASRMARGDLTDEIAAPKIEPGGDIIAHGGARFVQALPGSA